MFGKIKVKRRQETSYNGIPAPVLKSALQKYVRRGNLDKGLWCLVEMDLFSLVEVHLENATQKVRATALRTNLLNRLLVMTTEEISLAAWWMPLLVYRFARAWRKHRLSSESRKPLVDCYKHLVRAKKIRLISDLKSVYLLPPDYLKPRHRDALQAMHADLMLSLGLDENHEVDSENLLNACSIDLSSYFDGKDNEMRRILNGVLHGMKYGSDDVFYWIRCLIDRQRDDKGEPCFRGKKNPLNVLWLLIEGFARKREGLWGEKRATYPPSFDRLGEVIAVLRSWYESMTHREQPTYLYHAMLLIVRRNQIDWNSEPPLIDTPQAEVEALYSANLEGRCIELDSFVYDRHTGIREENSLTRFATEGALVLNEETSFRNEAYRAMYHQLKERLDSFSGEAKIRR